MARNSKLVSFKSDTLPCYIINLVTGTRNTFYVLPDEISDNNQAQFDAVSVRGSSTAIQGYNNSGPRTISYSLELHDDYCPDGIAVTVRRLRALTYPDYQGRVIPPSCYIRLGKMVGMRVVPGSVGVTWKKPLRNGMYVNATISLEFTETPRKAYSATNIEGGSDYYG